MKAKEEQQEQPPPTVEEPDLSGTYSAAHYMRWKLEELVELIRGKIVKMSPAPSSDHQSISAELTSQVVSFFKKRKCRAFHAPFDVYLVHPDQDYKTTQNIVEPDLCIICDPEKIRKFGCVGAPDLVVEILSPSTSKKDQKDKFELYEEYGVREYWIVFPESKSVMVYVLKNGQYTSHRPVTEAETLRSITFPKLEIKLQDVFENVSG